MKISIQSETLQIHKTDEYAHRSIVTVILLWSLIFHLLTLHLILLPDYLALDDRKKGK